MDDQAPVRFTLHHPPLTAGLVSDQPPVYYTAPGGWLIQRDVDPAAPDRPWVLRRHGRLIERCHTLRIAKHTANRTVQTAEIGTPT